MYVNRRDQKGKRASTNTDNNIKKTAEVTEDEELLLKITEVDLVAKEFRRHGKCYRDYTRVLYATKTKTPVNEKVILKTYVT